MKTLYYFIFAISFALLLIPGISNYDVANCHFYILIVLMVADFSYTKSISFFTIWIVAFIYMILSEMILYSNGNEYSWSIRYLLSANNVVLISYQMASSRIKYLKTNFDGNFVCKNRQLFFVIIVILYVLYVTQSFNRVVNNYSGTRHVANAMGGTSLYSSITNSVGLFLPTMIGYYVVKIENKSKWLALVIAAPIFLILLILATRFKVLFSVAPFFLITNFIRLKKISKNSLILMASLGALLIFVTNTMKENRSQSFEKVVEMLRENDEEYFSSNNPLSVSICKKCSPEGIVNMTRLANTYFEDHDLRYGECTGMLFYFWIPRKIWEKKPTQLDYWMPRQFNRGLDDTFTTASGFTGEVRADFGMLSYLFMILFGILLRKANSLLIMSNYGQKKSYVTLYVVALIPFFFFFVRSPLTASYNLIFEFIMIYFIGRICFSHMKMKTKEPTNLSRVEI